MIVRVISRFEGNRSTEVCGVDVVLVREGRISLMLTFLDDVPAKL
jgi:hypothetical protein